jgi:hypothetical protein
MRNTPNGLHFAGKGYIVSFAGNASFEHTIELLIWNAETNQDAYKEVLKACFNWDLDTCYCPDLTAKQVAKLLTWLTKTERKKNVK